MKANGWTPRARIVATANMGDDPTLMLNAPVPAAKKVLAKAGLSIDDIDLFEINEAFAVVAEKFIRDLDLDREGLTRHVAFSAGPRVCPGANLSRVEQQVAWGVLLDRLESMEYGEGNNWMHQPGIMLGTLKLNLRVKHAG